MSINRRDFFSKTGIGVTAYGLGIISPISCSNPKSENSTVNTKINDQQLFIGDDIAIANTVYGKVKGFILRDIYTFKGIPYGEDTAGKNRFMPPKKPKKWEGIKPTVFYGNSAPQDIYDRSPESYSAFVDHWNYDELSEDCLRLNLWTPGIDDKKRPVLVWLHGGGFARGNGIEQDGYNGENISKHGDIVYCSINHRLGPLGFTNLSSVDSKYRDSANVGMLDIIAALEWIQENIENFGGDPSNVTVMGQSGGGAKVCNVAAMPAAKGLVHKGIALSGTSIQGMEESYSQKLGEYILREANLTGSQADQLQNIPWAEYLKISHRAYDKLKKDLKNPELTRGGFAPVADGINIPKNTYFSDSQTQQPDIPILFCSTFHEWNPNRDNPELENISMDELINQLTPHYGTKAKDIIEGYIKDFPNAKPIEIWALISSNRKHVIEAANAKLKQKSPVYLAWFGWKSPLFDGRHRAFHCIDISFWFLNTDLMITHTGGGASPRNLSIKMADALINFMKNDDPNCSSLPTWPLYTKEGIETMILNNVCEVKSDPDGNGRNKI